MRSLRVNASQRFLAYLDTHEDFVKMLRIFKLLYALLRFVNYRSQKCRFVSCGFELC